MIWIPGGTFRMGSDHHYIEERPAHKVEVDGFWMDRYPVTNDRFRTFVEATGHVTFAEIPPKAEDYPGALPEMLYSGSLVFFKPEGPVDRQNIGNWWRYEPGADWRHPREHLSALAHAGNGGPASGDRNRGRHQHDLRRRQERRCGRSRSRCG
jgi:formylglycine-generating enzyme required for sulfatase activity